MTPTDVMTHIQKLRPICEFVPHDGADPEDSMGGQSEGTEHMQPVQSVNMHTCFYYHVPHETSPGPDDGKAECKSRCDRH